MIQGTPEWFAARCGKVTASRVPDVSAKTKSGWAAARANYMAQLITERLTGIPAETYTNAPMQWGIDNEALARAAYAFHTDADVTEVGFIAHPTMAMAGASPDGLVGADGLVEIKCPNTATHLATLLGEPTEGKYIAQMQFQMICADRKWCDFVSFDPRLPEPMRLHIHRVKRDDLFIAALENEVRAFLEEMDKKLDVLRAKYLQEKAA